ncbi:MAG: hypothetical protein ACOX3L_02820 [Lutisporaceae bacterium]
MKLKVLWTIAGSMGTVSDLEMLKNVKSFNIDVSYCRYRRQRCCRFCRNG